MTHPEALSPPGAESPIGRRPVSGRKWTVLAIVLALAALLAVVLFEVSQHSGTSVNKGGNENRVSLTAGMHVVFSDSFSGTSLDTAKWATCYPWFPTDGGCTNFANPELEWYLPSQVQVSKGVLHLVAEDVPTKGEAKSGAPMTYPWRSGMVTTYRSFHFTYGVLEVKARLVRGDGLWSALWLLPYPQSGLPEIDLAETYGEDPDIPSVVLHGVDTHPYRTFQTTDLSRGWHTFTLDWKRSSLAWYIDGTQVYSHVGSDVPDAPMYFLADLAVGNFVGSHPTALSPSPASLDIKSVAVYQR